MQVDALVASLRQQVAQLQEALQQEAQRAQQLDEQLQRLRLSAPHMAERDCGDGAAAGPALSCAPAAAGAAQSHTDLALPSAQHCSSFPQQPQQRQQHGQQHGEQHQAWGEPLLQQQAQGGAAVGEDLVVIGRSELELLRLKERAMNSVMEGITIADCSLPDQPLIYINDGFVRMTGYSAEFTLGKNCRWGLLLRRLCAGTGLARVQAAGKNCGRGFVKT